MAKGLARLGMKFGFPGHGTSRLACWVMALQETDRARPTNDTGGSLEVRYMVRPGSSF